MLKFNSKFLQIPKCYNIKIHFMNLRFLTTIIAVIAIVLPAQARAKEYSSAGEAFFVGAVDTLLLMFVYWLWRFFKDRNSQSKNTTSKDPIIKQEPISLWEEYKLTNAPIASSLESLTNEDLSQLSSKDINDLTATFKRMSTQFNCPVSELKDVCINRFTTQFGKDELPDVIRNLSVKAKEESKQYSISIENTMSHYLQKWITEYISCEN